MLATSKTCATCKQHLCASKFHTRKQNGKTYLYHCCRDCKSNDTREKLADGRLTKKPASRASIQASIKGKKERRAAGLDRDKYIVDDSRASDKKKGRENDLDRTFVAALIANPCSYCGGTELPMTVDRIDNTLGHIRTNVVPACFRCNLIRRDMPYEAWLTFSPVLRSLVETRGFGDWLSCHYSKRIDR